jgi:mRNA-degrading endonuclease RelE of RelBE toxin-antitoxin system
MEYKILYSETSRKQIKSLHPQLRPIIKSKLQHLSKNAFTGKFLERELAGYLSLSAKRYRIIYKVREEERLVEIHYIGHRKDIYELFKEQLVKE